jgi:hypothetical protein
VVKKGRRLGSSGLTAALSPTRLAPIIFLTEPALDMAMLGNGGWRSSFLVGTTGTASPEPFVGRELMVGGGEMSDQS